MGITKIDYKLKYQDIILVFLINGYYIYIGKEFQTLNS